MILYKNVRFFHIADFIFLQMLLVFLMLTIRLQFTSFFHFYWKVLTVTERKYILHIYVTFSRFSARNSLVFYT